MSITLEDAYNGRKKEVEYDRIIICPNCNGTGSLNPEAKPTCFHCNGTGKKIIRSGPLIMQTQEECEECKSFGKIIKDKCKECEGKMVKTIKRKIKIDLDKGVPDGHNHKLVVEGDEPLILIQ